MNRESTRPSAINQFLQEIQKDEYNPMPINEEREIARKAMGGDASARNRLITANLRLVVKIANEFKNSSNCPVPVEDLIGAGNTGLIKAAGKYDPDKSVKFSTYSAWWIKAMIRKQISQLSNSVSFSNGIANRILKIKKNISEAEKTVGHEITFDEFVTISGKKKSNTLKAYFEGYRQVSLDENISEDNNRNVSNLIPDSHKNPSEEIEHDDLIEYMMIAFEKVLNDNEKEILKCRMGFYGKEMTFKEISETKLTGMTFQRIQQIEETAKNKMKEAINA